MIHGDLASINLFRVAVRSVFLGLALACFQPAHAAQSLTLAWDQSSDPSVTGYRVYYGGATRTYTNSVDAGNATSVNVTGLADGSTHYFAATAYNNIGLESAYSREIAVTFSGSGGTNPPPPGGGTITVAVSITGEGSVTPDLNGQALTIGKTFTLTAAPKAGQVFGGWTGSLVSSNPKLTFVATSNLVLQAAFVANPFGPMAGSYSGLFYEPDAVRINRSGAVALTVSRLGAYSGSVRMATQRASFHGKLDVLGHSSTLIVMKGASPISLDFQLTTGLPAGQVSGLVSNATFTAPLLADQAAFNSRTNPALFAGTYTLLIPGTNGDTAIPAGYGFGFTRVNPNGKARFAGILADGTRASQGVTISPAAAWPLFVPLPAGGGQVLSWLTFAHLTNSDLSGTLSWIKSAGGKTPLYPDGFTNICQAVGSGYSTPVNQNILGLTEAQLLFSGGDLSSNLVQSVGLGPRNKVLIDNPDNFSLSFSLSTGTFRGRTFDPATGSWLRFNGAVLPTLDAGYGFLIGPAHSGQVVLQP